MAANDGNLARLAAERYVEAINSWDYRKVVALWAEDSVWQGQLETEQRGLPAITALYQRLMERHPSVGIGSSVAEGNMCVIELVRVDRETGETRPGTLDHFTVDDDGKITRMAVYKEPLA
jgi:predicted SnoaL-like aldol condensation-catalyzing enzyme